LEEADYALLGIDVPDRRSDRGRTRFTGVAVAAAGMAKILFVVFLVLFLISIVAHRRRRSLN
jgi:uncharacterized membrane protein YtjA (UPF0391 family)